MKWHGKDGGYEAGPYRVERGEARKWWVARGPGVGGEDGVARHEIKADAQADCEDAALLRIEGQGMTVEPVVGDIAVPLSSRRSNPIARVTTVMASNGGAPLYCLRFNVGGGRECLFRHEFEVVLP